MWIPQEPRCVLCMAQIVYGKAKAECGPHLSPRGGCVYSGQLQHSPTQLLPSAPSLTLAAFERTRAALII